MPVHDGINSDTGYTVSSDPEYNMAFMPAHDGTNSDAGYTASWATQSNMALMHVQNGANSHKTPDGIGDTNPTILSRPSAPQGNNCRFFRIPENDGASAWCMGCNKLLPQSKFPSWPLGQEGISSPYCWDHIPDGYKACVNCGQIKELRYFEIRPNAMAKGYSDGCVACHH